MVNILTRLYLNSVPVAFLKWKTLTKINRKSFKNYIYKTRKIVKLMEGYLKHKRDQASRCFNYWAFQTKMKFPFYLKNSHAFKFTKLVNNENKRKALEGARPFGSTKAATTFDILIKVNDLRECIDKKFKDQKRMFFWSLRIFFEMEDIILNSKQAMLVRNIRLNEHNFYGNRKSFRRHYEVKPRKFLMMLDGKNIHEQPEYAPEKRNYYKNTYFRAYMTKLRQTRQVSKSSSAMLLTGVWSQNLPYMKFREQLFCYVLETNFAKKTKLALLKLQEFNTIMNFIERKKEEQELKMKAFKRTWAKIWMLTLFRDKFNRGYLFAMKRLEINKRLSRLIEQKKLMMGENKHKTMAETSKNIGQRNIKKILEECFSVRMGEVQDHFPKQFVKILMTSKGGSGHIKRELVNLLFETVFYLICDVIQDVKYNNIRYTL